MHILSAAEASRMLSIDPADAVSMTVGNDACAFLIPQEGARQVALAKLLARLFIEKADLFLWVTGWGVWPSSENWELFNSYRKAHGELRSLMEAPVHLLTTNDEGPLSSLLCFILLFGWDAIVIKSTAKEPMMAISHDEWFELQSNAMIEGVERALRQFDLTAAKKLS